MKTKPKRPRHPGVWRSRLRRGGQACVRGTRVSVVEVLQGVLRGGVRSAARGFKLKPWQVQDAIQYAQQCVRSIEGSVSP